MATVGWRSCKTSFSSSPVSWERIKNVWNGKFSLKIFFYSQLNFCVCSLEMLVSNPFVVLARSHNTSWFQWSATVSGLQHLKSFKWVLIDVQVHGLDGRTKRYLHKLNVFSSNSLYILKLYFDKEIGCSL